MDVFSLRNVVIEDYGTYVRSFLTIKDERIRRLVQEEMDGGFLWPDPLIQLNPSFKVGETLQELIDNSELHPECINIFRDKREDGTVGAPFRLHRHQIEGIRAARAGDSYVLTTGTGSGKSLSYIVPIVDHVLRSGSGRGIQAIIVYSDIEIPNRVALRAGYDPRDQEAAEARERRLFHVAMTRARDELTVSWSGGHLQERGMIKRIYIDNFRCFSNFELKPDRINLLFGVNGSGKSSFVDVFDRIIALIIDGREVSELFSEIDFTRWDTREQQSFELDLGIDSVSPPCSPEGDSDTFTYRATLERRPTEGGMALHNEHVTCGNRTLFRYEDGDVHLYKNDGKQASSFPFRGNRSFLAGIEERPETVDLMGFLTRLRSLRTYKLDPTRMTSVTHEEQPALDIMPSPPLCGVEILGAL